MNIPIIVPAVGESVTEATIASFLEKEGNFVEKEQEILELETDKVNQTLYAPATGIVHWSVKQGDTVHPEQEIGSIEEKEPSEKPQEQKTPTEPEQRYANAGLRVTEEQFLEKKEPEQLPQEKKQEPIQKETSKKEQGVKRVAATKLRKIVAQRLTEVKQQTAMLTTFNEVNMAHIVELRKKEQERFSQEYGVKLGFMSFFLKACVMALQKFPEVNASFQGEDILYYQYYHIGVAVSTEKGLMVPVIRDVDQKKMHELEKALQDFAKKAREGTIDVSALQGGTFTITNGGVFGSLLSTPILNPGQSAILGMHTIQQRPIAVEEKVVVCPMMYLALSYDHRIIDGKEAIGFLQTIKECLEDPNRMLFG